MWLSGKESTHQCKRCRRCGFNPWVRKIPWSKNWQPTPVFLSGKPHEQRSLMGYSPRGLIKLYTTEHTDMTHFSNEDFQGTKPIIKDDKAQDLIILYTSLCKTSILLVKKSKNWGRSFVQDIWVINNFVILNILLLQPSNVTNILSHQK